MSPRRRSRSTAGPSTLDGTSAGPADEVPLEVEEHQGTRDVISSAVAILKREWDPEPNSSLTREATLEVRVFSCGLYREMMKCGNSSREFHNLEPVAEKRTIPPSSALPGER